MEGDMKELPVMKEGLGEIGSGLEERNAPQFTTVDQIGSAHEDLASGIHKNG
jgi:hypothetical protein